MLDIIAALLGAIAAAGIGLECNHDLVHERFVEVAAKYGIRRGNGGGGLALIIQELEFHGLCSFAGRRFDGWTHNDIGVIVARDGALDTQEYRKSTRTNS